MKTEGQTSSSLNLGTIDVFVLCAGEQHDVAASNAADWAVEWRLFQTSAAAVFCRTFWSRSLQLSSISSVPGEQRPALWGRARLSSSAVRPRARRLPPKWQARQPSPWQQRWKRILWRQGKQPWSPGVETILSSVRSSRHFFNYFLRTVDQVVVYTQVICTWSCQ